MLIRGRGPGEHGLLFTTIDDIRLVDFSGAGDDPAAGYSMANELPIHGETLRARPQVNAVVHAHPPAVRPAASPGCTCAPSSAPTTSRPCGWRPAASPSTRARC